MIHSVTLLPGITLQCFTDTRFKQEGFSVQFVRPMCREEAALNALLPAVLLRGCQSAPDLRAITLRLDDLYGAALGSRLRRVGDYQTTGLSCSFMREEYTLDGDKVFAPMVAFLEELLFCPLMEDGAFCKSFVEGEKKNLLAAIASKKNDKRAYAANRLIQIMGKGDSISVPRLGEAEDVKAITPKSLYAHYQKILRESPVNIFYVGAADPAYIADVVRPMFEKLERSPVALPAQSAFHDLGGSEETEVMEVTQGRLCMGFTCESTCRDEGFVAMQLLNAIFGGGMTSKLFMKIREEQSLCYEIGSSYQGSKGILTAEAGIDFAMFNPVREEILRQLQACRQGDFTAQELESARQAILSSLKSTHDSPGAIEGYYVTTALNGLPLSPEEYARAVENATAEQVAEAAQKVKLHSVYFLRGEQ